jgi:YceI-like domain
MLNLISGYLAISFVSFITILAPAQKVVFKTTSGSIKFISEAPLETIKAKSDELKGILDTTKNTFAFSVSVHSFQGFNSPLQLEHFYENYMEVTEFPQATFSGKIIELIDYTKPGTYNVRAKGILNIHGVKTERIIRGSVEIKKNQMLIRTSFAVPLQEHNIKIPRIVNQKISSEITVEIDAILVPDLI